jgi:hypothetical protein
MAASPLVTFRLAVVNASTADQVFAHVIEASNQLLIPTGLNEPTMTWVDGLADRRGLSLDKTPRNGLYVSANVALVAVFA